MDRAHAERFLEFALIGVALGVVEDLVAVKLATGEPLTLQMIGIIVAVTVPFAAFSELVVDSQDYRVHERLLELEFWKR